MQADLLSHFSLQEDPRVDRTKRYPLNEIIFLIISATIANALFLGLKSVEGFGKIVKEKRTQACK